MVDDGIEVVCECGEIHRFALAHAGRIARCPGTGKRFRVPTTSERVVFLEEHHAEHICKQEVDPLRATLDDKAGTALGKSPLKTRARLLQGRRRLLQGAALLVGVAILTVWISGRQSLRLSFEGVEIGSDPLFTVRTWKRDRYYRRYKGVGRGRDVNIRIIEVCISPDSPDIRGIAARSFGWFDGIVWVKAIGIELTQGSDRGLAGALADVSDEPPAEAKCYNIVFAELEGTRVMRFRGMNCSELPSLAVVEPVAYLRGENGASEYVVSICLPKKLFEEDKPVNPLDFELFSEGQWIKGREWTPLTMPGEDICKEITFATP